MQILTIDLVDGLDTAFLAADNSMCEFDTAIINQTMINHNTEKVDLEIGHWKLNILFFCHWLL